MLVIIKSLTGTCFELIVSAYETILSLKTKIQRLEGIPTSQQHLIWQNLHLEDDNCLRDYDIIDGCTLKLVLAMRGGPISTRKVSIDEELSTSNLFDDSINEDFSPPPTSTSKRRQVTLLVYREGDQINFFRVTNRGDGTLTPFSESYSDSTLNNYEDDNDDEVTSHAVQEMMTSPTPPKLRRVRKILENNLTATKMKQVRKQMQNVSLLGNSLKPNPPKMKKPENLRKLKPMTSPTDNDVIATSSDSKVRKSLFNRHDLYLKSYGLFQERNSKKVPKIFLDSELKQEENSFSRFPILQNKFETKTDLYQDHKYDRKPLEEVSENLCKKNIQNFTRGKLETRRNVIDFINKTVDSKTLQEIITTDEPSNSEQSICCKSKSALQRNAIVSCHGNQQLPTTLPPVKKSKKKRCFLCGKKTGLATSYVCRCGLNFCAIHRYAELHSCTFDYKSAGRKVLQTTNPVVQAPKLPKI